MRKFAETYLDFEIVQQFAAQIPEFHNCVLLDKVKNKVKRERYIQQAIENGGNLFNKFCSLCIKLKFCSGMHNLLMKFAVECTIYL